jgi:hypothetical protein
MPNHVQRYGVELFQAICQRDCEGIVAKHKRATYGVQGPTDWYKILNPAYTQKPGRRELFNGVRDRACFPGCVT